MQTKNKFAHIIPIHKGGHQGLPANYRPIALTSLIIKLFEKIVRTNIAEHLDSNNLLNNSQHGFRKGRSCVSQLLNHYDKILSLLESGLNVDVIYLDFAKAFDKVDHAIVLSKLSLLGIKGKLLDWIKSFLTDRTQYVVVNGFLSDPCKVISGVPQGSVLGPLLFLVLIGDIDADINSSFLSSFADDTRVGKGIKATNDAIHLQTDLKSVYQWAIDNNMEFNNTKFELLQYGLNFVIKKTVKYFAPDGTQITAKSHVKDLGVLMSSDGTFSEQINKICQSARDMCSWILRTFKSRSPVLMKTTWRTLVLPILDYCSQLWCPTKPGQIKQIESIQQSFTRKIASNASNYWERLSNFKLYSLQRRRERYRIIYVWKILESHVPNISCEGDSGIKKLHSLRNGRSCAISPLLNSTPTAIQRLREGSLTYHGAKLFNALPKDLRNTTNCSTLAFKHKLDKFLAQIIDQPLVDGYTSGRQAESNSLLHMIPLAHRNQMMLPQTKRVAPATRK